MPVKTVVNVALSAAEVSLYFDSTGRAQLTSPYAGWAVCNGNNGTPNLSMLSGSGRRSVTASNPDRAHEATVLSPSHPTHRFPPEEGACFHSLLLCS